MRLPLCFSRPSSYEIPSNACLFFSPTLPPFNKTLHNGHKNITTFLQFSWSQRHSSLIFLTSNSLFYDIPKGTSFFSSECSIPPAVNYWLTGEFNPTIRLIFLSLARISIYRFLSFLLWTEINVIFYPKTSFNSSFLSVFFFGFMFLYQVTTRTHLQSSIKTFNLSSRSCIRERNSLFFPSERYVTTSGW